MVNTLRVWFRRWTIIHTLQRRLCYLDHALQVFKFVVTVFLKWTYFRFSARVGRKHLPNVYFSLREASKHLPSRPKHLQPAPTVTRARPGGGPLPHSPGAPRPGQPLATYLGPKAARYAGISPVLARLNPLFRSKNPYQTLRISSKHLRQTLRFGPKHLPNTPQKVLRPTLYRTPHFCYSFGSLYQ